MIIVPYLFSKITSNGDTNYQSKSLEHNRLIKKRYFDNRRNLLLKIILNLKSTLNYLFHLE